MALDGYNPNRSTTRNELHQEQLALRADILRTAGDSVCDMVYVYDYDPVNQTVDVVLAGDRRALPIRGIPIAGAGGQGIRVIRAWKGLLQTDKPDIGLLVYPRLGAGRKVIDFIRRDTNRINARIEKTAIFFGGIPAALSAGESQVGVDGTPAFTQIGKGDNGIVKPSGAGFMVKEDDSLVLRGTKIYVLGLNQTQADAHPVARQGDAGDGLGGVIAGGSSLVLAG